MRIYVHVLIVLALVLAGISPACAFISGQTELAEICTSHGIEYKETSGTPAHDSHEKKTDCMFCFAQTHGKSLKSDTIILKTSRPPTGQAAIASVQAVSSAAFYNPHSARAPPVFLI